MYSNGIIDNKKELKLTVTRNQGPLPYTNIDQSQAYLCKKEQVLFRELVTLLCTFLFYIDYNYYRCCSQYRCTPDTILDLSAWSFFITFFFAANKVNVIHAFDSTKYMS